MKLPWCTPHIRQRLYGPGSISKLISTPLSRISRRNVFPTRSCRTYSQPAPLHTKGNPTAIVFFVYTITPCLNKIYFLSECTGHKLVSRCSSLKSYSPQTRHLTLLRPSIQIPVSETLRTEYPLRHRGAHQKGDSPSTTAPIAYVAGTSI